MNASPVIDYSSKDFNKARAVIDAASRNNRISETNPDLNNKYSNRKIRQVGDTTVVTENRDPYSFYWQLDKQKKVEEPIRKPPANDLMDVEESIEVNFKFLVIKFCAYYSKLFNFPRLAMIVALI